MIQLLTRCFTRYTRSMSRALVTSALALLTALSLSTTTHANVDRVTYLHYDGLGSAIAATDEQGAIQWRENYQPYGQRTKYEATNHNVWFTGKPEEEDFALQYYGGRWYDPNLGRFNSIDPQGFVESSPMSFNRYAYGNNNPYSYVDPDGELPFLVPLAIFLVKEAAAEVASHYTDGWSDFLSVRRMATRGWRGVRNAFGRNGGDVPRSVRHGPTNPGPLADDVAATFRGGSYTAKTTSEATTLYRVYGGNARQLGPYWTRTKPSGPLQSQLDSALNPQWGNTANNVTSIEVPKGTQIFEGAAAPQPTGVGQILGGGNQVYIPRVNPNWIQ